MASFTWGTSASPGGVTTYADFASLPSTDLVDGQQAVTLDTDILYIYNLATTTWIAVGGASAVLSIGAVGSTPNANAGVITSNNLTLEPADGTHPGVLTAIAQIIGGAKTFTGAISASNLSGSNTGDQTITLTGDVTGSGIGSFASTLATVNTDVGNFGTVDSVPTLTLNGKGLVTAASNTSIQIVESQVTNLVSDLSGKQATGNYITDLTGDATASGPGSSALTLATVNANIGSFGSASTSSSFTVNGKGLITAASSTSIQIAESQVTNLVSDLAGKQATGNYITALTSDISASGPGSVAATVISVGGSTAANINTATSLVNSSNAQNKVFASPSGSTGVATFRVLVASDIPSLSATYVTQSEVGTISGVASLDGSGHIPLSQLPSSLVEYKGTWDASTNTPTLSNSSGANNISGYFFIVSTGGTVDFGAGNITFNASDWVLFNGTIWEQAVQATVVQSVNGSVGVVTVNAINQLTGDVTAGPASGSQSKASTVAAIQGITVSGTTGSRNVVFSTSPILVTPNLGTPSALVGTNITGTATNFTSSNVTTNANLTGPVTSVGNTTSVTTNAISNTMLAQMPTLTIKGNNTGGTANALDLTVAQVNAILPIFTSTLNGLAPLSGGGSTNYLRADGTWAAPAGATNGTVTSVAVTVPSILSVSGSPITTSGTIAITLANESVNTVFAGPSSGGSTTPTFRSLVSTDIPDLSATYVVVPTGYITTTSFTGANNQSTVSNVTGLSFANASVRGFKALVTVTVIATSNLYEIFELIGIQRGSDWAMSVGPSVGDLSLVDFTITSVGQIQYTSGNYSGFTSLTIKFSASGLPV